MNNKRLLLAWLLACLQPFAAFADDRICLELDVDGYFLISSAEDWKAFAAKAEENPNINAKMTADIDLGDDQTIIGLTVAFQGIFDGQGHTLNVNYCQTDQWAAPFGEIKNSIIKNLRVTGNINGFIHSSRQVPQATGCL